MLIQVLQLTPDQVNALDATQKASIVQLVSTANGLDIDSADMDLVHFAEAAIPRNGMRSQVDRHMAFRGSISPSGTSSLDREGFIIRKHIANSSIMHPYEIFLRSSASSDWSIKLAVIAVVAASVYSSSSLISSIVAAFLDLKESPSVAVPLTAGVAVDFPVEGSAFSLASAFSLDFSPLLRLDGVPSGFFFFFFGSS